jgi:chromosome segregation ATPase
MSKLVSNEIYDVVEKLHKAGLSDAVAIEVIRHTRDYDLSKLATSDQVNDLRDDFHKLEGKVNDLRDDFHKLEGKVDLLEKGFHNLEGKVNDLRDDFHKLDRKVNDLEVEVKLLKQEVGHIKENMVTKLEFSDFKREVDVKLGELKTEVEVKLGELKTDIAATGSSLMRWFIALFATQVISVVGVMLTLFLK